MPGPIKLVAAPAGQNRPVGWPRIFLSASWCPLLCLSLLLAGAAPAAHGQLVINELLFNPPFGDATNEFIELRGAPNYQIPNRTYLVGVEGDAEENPGVVQNIFDLSDRRLGQNGFLALLQKYHRYRIIPYSAVVTNADSGLGWGSGSSSGVDHDGESDIVEIENPSATFFLIQSAERPSLGDDIDANNDGIIDHTNAVSWIVLDAVGVLDNDGLGDIAYGRINFRRATPPGSLATASGLVVPVSFTAGYVGRSSNTTAWARNDWVASDNLLGRPPTFFLGGVAATTGTNTFPEARRKATLNHIGGPNFKTPPVPAVLVQESRTNTLVSEAGLRDYYTLALSLRPTGAVSIQITAQEPAQVSVDGGRTFAFSALLPLTTISPKKVLVRAVDDRRVGPNELPSRITHSVASSLDTRFDGGLEILPVKVTVTDTNLALLGEAKINPPGEDAPFEFVELRGTPGGTITNLHLLSVQGNTAQNPGVAEFAMDLNGLRFGSNGLLVIAAPGHPYLFSPLTTVALAPVLTNAGGAFNNGSLSLLLVGSRTAVTTGADLDAGDNGTLEGLPEDSVIVDAIAWQDGGAQDVIYGGVDLSQRRFTPDAASRLAASIARRSAAAWLVGDLFGTAGDSLEYDSASISTNVPPGSVMTPGIVNRKAPRLTPNPLRPITAVLGREGNESLTFTLSVLEDDDDNFDPDDDPDDYIPATALTVTVTSTNQAVVPDSGLALTNLGRGKWHLTINPVGVGYTDIIIRATDGVYTRLGFLHYAVSDEGRPGALWHPHVSDASTAVAIDANWMFVGDDENQILRVFSRTKSGPPVKGTDFSTALRLRDIYDEPESPIFGEPREVDIEGSTRVANRIYWMGSHSHAFNAMERTNRGRIFATDMSGSGTNAQLRLLSHYDFLKLDLIEWDANNVHGKGAHYYGLKASAGEGTDPKAPDGSGFNLEGLCMAPGPNNTTNCYIAFRAPLVPPTNRVHALILPVLNYGRLTTKSGGPGSAQFGAPIELNLGGRAIRSIEGHGGTNYLIVAGPPGAPDTNGYVPPPGNFRLFTWNGQATNQPAERAADLSRLNAEGIVEVYPGPWTAATTFQILSDNGTNVFYGDGIQAKHLQLNYLPREFKKFRVDTIALGEVVTPSPVIRSVTAFEGVITITWFSVSGLTYRVQMRASVEAAWQDIAGDIVADAATTSRSVIAPGPDTQCFFRVVVVP